MDVVKVAITKFADFRLTKTGTRCVVSYASIGTMIRMLLLNKINGFKLNKE
jgi:hypothetical protein